MRGCILVVEDDADMRQMLDDELREAGFEVVLAASGDEALDRFDPAQVDAVVTDLMMPGMRGEALLGALREVDRQVPVVIMTGFGSVESAVQSMKEGALHYLTKPFKVEQLVEVLRDAVRERHVHRRLVAALVEGRTGAPAIVAESTPMRRALEIIARAAPSSAAVLLLGESGTGKELMARALHAASPRRERPFVAVNCSAIPEHLLESELFGHRRGAFTDAHEDRRGLFLEADGGTVFLDEIGDMALPLQAKLLRVLQEREVHAVGAPAPVPVDVRVVAATHRPLATIVEEGRFRRDLYYRLNVIEIDVPPLRERPKDLLPLVAHFLEKHGRALGKPGWTMESSAVEALARHGWPGNVRELENVIERAMVLGHGPSIGVGDLPEAVRASRPGAGSGTIRSIAEMEREQIIQALRSVRGNKAAAARLLGFDRKTLYRKLDAYGIKTEPGVP